MNSDEIKIISKKIIENLSNDLRKTKYKKSQNFLAGHCYVATEALFYLLNKKEKKFWKPRWVKHENDTHWYIQNIETKQIIDLTRKQFKTKVPYHKGIGCGFLTKKPSKRTKILLSRIKKENKHE